MRGVTQITDDQVSMCEAGPVDFELLVRQHKDAVYRQMMRVCGNRQDAEDVLIEALFKAYRNLDQLRDSAAFRAWLAAIAGRVCWQLRKREALLPILQLSVMEQEGRELSTQEPSVESKLETAQMKEMLLAAIASLPDRYRSVYAMRDLQDLEGAEVARRLRISLPAMKSRLLRARALVRQQLDTALLRGTPVKG
jgi:RNA polymerase sigma-70 factor (ECF subfamily)